jgi:hypothetical protein
MLAVLSLICFFAGGILGWAAARGGPSVQRSWPVVLRIQILATSATLSLVAVWRLTSIGELLGPLGLAAGLWVMFFCAEATRGRRSAGTGALEAWAVSPNSGFWVVPAATAFAGATGAMIAVLANVITSAWSAVCVHLMRRDAPVRQRRATSWVDQSPILASFAGLILLAIHSAPEWSSDVLIVAAPLLAFSGAALFTGSMLHPHNVGVVRTEHALRRWTWLTGVRVAYYLALVGVAALASSTALAVVAVLSGLSAPSFQPVQQAVLYGYRSEVVMTAIRWGWLLVPAGLGLALLVR